MVLNEARILVCRRNDKGEDVAIVGLNIEQPPLLAILCANDRFLSRSPHREGELVNLLESSTRIESTWR